MDYGSYARRLDEAPDAGARQAIKTEMTQESVYMSVGRGYEVDHAKVEPEPQTYRVTLDVTDQEMELLQTAVWDQIEKSERYIKRAQDHPSESLKSELTQDRHRAKIDAWKALLGKLNENVW